MFKSQNFCHIASNNRNNVKVGVFVYRTTDNLATVTTSGYFNGRIIDINLHDLIIHEQIDATDPTKVKQNLLCVTVRTLENVGTSLIKSDWQGDIEQAIADLETYVNNNFLKLDGSSTMTGVLKMRASVSFECAVAPYWHGVGLYQLNDNDSVTLLASMEATDGFEPGTNNTYNIGSTSKKWKNLYLSGKAYMSVINNGYDIAVPVTNSADTLALKSQVDLAANSGSQLYDTGVWYAKMNSDTVVPTGAEYNDRNYADFSQVDRRSGRPVIVIYSCRNGVWDEVETITPPDSYNGYITITSKIWDIPEQAGQQGGEILWSFERQRFTPYPKIVSFESINVTGDSTVVMPQNPTGSSIVNKDYVDNHIPTGNFYHPDLFAWDWSDALRNDVQWLRADTFSWQQGSVYKAAYKHLRNDMFNWYSWENNGTTIYTKKAYPEVGEKVYSDSALTTEVGEITAVTDTLDITVEKITVNDVVYDSVSGSNISPTTETIAGVTVQYIPAEDGHKIVTDFHISEAEAVYAATGVAWYYIIDYGFKRFKLPRVNPDVVKQGFGMIPVKGNGLVLGLTNGTGTAGTTFNSNTTSINPHTGSYGLTVSSSGTQTASGLSGRLGVTSDSTKSGIIADPTEQTTIFSGKKHLYFYVGEFTQTAIENTAGITTETINTLGAHIVTEVQIPTAENNYTWYRKYADGWVEQGGVVASMPSSKYQDVVFPVTMANTNYTPLVTASWSESSAGQNEGVQNLTTTGMRVTASYATATVWWEVKGMAQA